jgi:hypothetical protein
MTHVVGRRAGGPGWRGGGGGGDGRGGLEGGAGRLGGSAGALRRGFHGAPLRGARRTFAAASCLLVAVCLALPAVARAQERPYLITYDH